MERTEDDSSLNDNPENENEENKDIVMEGLAAQGTDNQNFEEESGGEKGKNNANGFGCEKLSLDEVKEAQDTSCDKKQTFKKLKKSHSRNYRAKNEDFNDTIGDASENLNDTDDPVASTSATVKNVLDEDVMASIRDARKTDDLIGPLSADALESIEDSDDEMPRDRDRDRLRTRRIVRAEDLDSCSSSSDAEGPNDDDDSSSNSSDSEGNITVKKALPEKAKDVLSKPKSLPKYYFLEDVINRQYGFRTRPTFTEKRCGSEDMVGRFQLAYKLAGHEGCVNSLHFNQTGTKIASGSDDLQIIIWDWEKRKKLVGFNSGHKANVFQSKFLPGDLLVASCSRDGQVRLAELSVTGALRSTKKVGQHRGPAHKMTLVPDCPQLMLSAGEDGQVLAVDIREQKPDKILILKSDKDKKIPIYSINSNPANGFQFCTAGRDQYIRIFDRRYVGTKNGEVVKFCPQNLVDNEQFKAYITCAVFNKSGQEVIGSYNDEDIYLFNTSHTEGADYVKRYQGHRNSATVKGVNFYGPNSEFVVSGSDCGNIFFWDKETERIVKLLDGDENGVVNVLEPHPNLPVMATSGLDEEVKVWLPTQKQEGPDRETVLQEEKAYLEKIVSRNLSDRENHRNSEPDALDGQMLWVLWRHIR